jgi:hypothetical protein
VDILFGQKLNGPVTISQAGVNRVVQSLRKLPADEMGSDHNSHN